MILRLLAQSKISLVCGETSRVGVVFKGTEFGEPGPSIAAILVPPHSLPHGFFFFRLSSLTGVLLFGHLGGPWNDSWSFQKVKRLGNTQPLPPTDTALPRAGLGFLVPFGRTRSKPAQSLRVCVLLFLQWVSGSSPDRAGQADSSAKRYEKKLSPGRYRPVIRRLTQYSLFGLRIFFFSSYWMGMCSWGRGWGWGRARTFKKSRSKGQNTVCSLMCVWEGG